MSNAYTKDDSTSFVIMSIQKLLFAALVGAIAGVAVWGLTPLLDTYVYRAILCGDPNSVQCSSSLAYATTTAAVIAGAIGLFGLVRLQIFRPLLIVVAVFISLWGVVALVDALPWYYAAMICTALYAAAFATFAWIARIRNFLFAIILIILIIVALRLVLNS